MSATESDRQGTGEGADKRIAETKAAAGRRTRGGTSYQHSLSAKGIKSSGRARSQTNEDLLSSLKRLERAASQPLLDDADEGRSRSRAFGREGGRTPTARTAHRGEKHVRGPRFDW